MSELVFINWSAKIDLTAYTFNYLPLFYRTINEYQRINRHLIALKGIDLFPFDDTQWFKSTQRLSSNLWEIYCRLFSRLSSYSDIGAWKYNKFFKKGIDWWKTVINSGVNFELIRDSVSK